MTSIAPQTRALAKRLRRDMTPQERKVWLKLRELNVRLGLHFRRQAAVGPFITDFAEFGRKLVIEVDGGGHGGLPDQARDAWLAGRGLAVLRFWNSDVEGNIDGVMDCILDALEVAPPPRPSPAKGEGRAERATPLRRHRGRASPPPCGKGMGEGGPAAGSVASGGESP